MEWHRNLGLLLINILMLCICILLVIKKHNFGTYFFFMLATMVTSYVVDSLAFLFRLLDYPLKYIINVYMYGGLGLTFTFIFLMYQNLIKDPFLKNISRVISLLFLLFYLFKIFTIKASEGFPETIMFFNVFLLLFVIALFMLDTFKTDLIMEISHYYPFWFSLGLIIIYVGVIPSIIISQISASTMTNGLWSFIMFLINFIGYGLLLIGLVKAKKLDK